MIHESTIGFLHIVIVLSLIQIGFLKVGRVDRGLTQCGSDLSVPAIQLAFLQLKPWRKWTGIRLLRAMTNKNSEGLDL